MFDESLYIIMLKITILFYKYLKQNWSFREWVLY